MFADEGFLHHERRKADVAFSSLNALRSLLALRAGGPGIALVTFGAFDVADQ